MRLLKLHPIQDRLELPPVPGRHAPGPQGAEHVGQGFAVGTTLAAQRGAEQADQPVALAALGQFGIGEDQGLGEGIGQGGIGTRAAAGLGVGGV
jgi:hypothetical protein